MELTGRRYSNKRGRSCNDKMSISIINTDRHGKRISLSFALVEALGNPETVQMRTSKNNLKIGTSLKNCSVDFKLSRQNVIYNSGLVREITECFNLDFSERTSITFDEISIKTRRSGDEDIPYALIKIGEEIEE